MVTISLPGMSGLDALTITKLSIVCWCKHFLYILYVQIYSLSSALIMAEGSSALMTLGAVLSGVGGGVGGVIGSGALWIRQQNCRPPRHRPRRREEMRLRPNKRYADRKDHEAYYKKKKKKDFPSRWGEIKIYSNAVRYSTSVTDLWNGNSKDKQRKKSIPIFFLPGKLTGSYTVASCGLKGAQCSSCTKDKAVFNLVALHSPLNRRYPSLHLLHVYSCNNKTGFFFFYVKMCHLTIFNWILGSSIWIPCSHFHFPPLFEPRGGLLYVKEGRRLNGKG